MWVAYVRLLDRIMAKEDPNDPFSARSITPEDLAVATVALSIVVAVMCSYMYITYCV